MMYQYIVVLVFACGALFALSNAQLESFAQQQEVEKNEDDEQQQPQQPNERSPITKIFLFKGEKKDDDDDALDYGKTFGDIFSKMMMFNQWKMSNFDKPIANSNNNNDNGNANNNVNNNDNKDNADQQSSDFQSGYKAAFSRPNANTNNNDNNNNDQQPFEFQPMLKMPFFRPSSYDGNNKDQADDYQMSPMKSSFGKQSNGNVFDYQPYQQPEQSITPPSMMFQPPPFYMRPPLVMPQSFTPPSNFFSSFSKSNGQDTPSSSASDGQFYIEDTDSESSRFDGSKSKFGATSSSGAQTDKEDTGSNNRNNNNNNNAMYKQKDRLKNKKPIDIVKIVEILPSAEPFGCSCGPMMMKSGWHVGKRCAKRCAAHQHHSNQMAMRSESSSEEIYQG